MVVQTYVLGSHCLQQYVQDASLSDMNVEDQDLMPAEANQYYFKKCDKKTHFWL